MPERRVGITGLGVVSPAGVGAEAFWNALTSGQSFAAPVGGFDASGFPCRIAAEVKDFSARDFVPRKYRKAVKIMARDIELAVGVSDCAFRDAGITTRGLSDDGEMDIEPGRLGCNIGAGLICSDLDELGAAVNTALVDGKFDLNAWGREGMFNLTPLWLLKYLPNMLSCHVTIIHGAEGPSNCITCGDASGLLAVGESTRSIARGTADVTIAGGAESKCNAMGFTRQHLLNRVCTRHNDSPATACRPFAPDADGTVIGEGGGMVILEDMDRARGRGAKIYAEVVGFGAACDPAGIDVTSPNAGSLDLAVTKALADAGIAPADVDLVVAHGTGVAGEDACEAAAWKKALGDRLAEIPATTITGCVGSLFAGAGGAEVAATCLALANQTVPPAVNAGPADHAGLNLSGQARPTDIEYAVVGAFTVGGQSGACVLRRVSE